MNRIPFIFCLIVCSSLVASAVTDAQELPLRVEIPNRTEPVDYASEIAPILKKNCLACHHEKEAEGGLNLETLEHPRLRISIELNTLSLEEEWLGV